MTLSSTSPVPPVLCIRLFRPSDQESVNKVALPAFDRYQQADDDWPTFRVRLAQMADLADLLVAEAQGEVLGVVVHVGPAKPRSATFPTIGRSAWAITSVRLRTQPLS